MLKELILKTENEELQSRAYEKCPWYLRRSLAREAANQAEWQVPEGRIGGLVRQQRHRAHIAARRGRWLFLLLFVVITLALANYVGTEIWRQLQDATKIGLEAEARSFDAQLEQMDKDRNNAWGAIKSSIALSVRLTNPNEWGQLHSSDWKLSTNGYRRLVRINADGRVEYTDDAGRNWENTRVPLVAPDATLNHLQIREPGGSDLLFFTRVDSIEGMASYGFPAYVSQDGGATWSNSRLPNTDFANVKINRVSNFDSVVFAQTSEGSLISDDFGGNWQITNHDTKASRLIRFENYILAIDPRNRSETEESITQISIDEGATWQEFQVPQELGPHFSLFETSPDQIIVAGQPENGSNARNYFRSRNLGRNWEQLSLEEAEEASAQVVIEPIVVNTDFVSVSLENGSFYLVDEGGALTVRKESSNGEIVLSIAAALPYFDAVVTNNSDLAVLLFEDVLGRPQFMGSTDGGKTWRQFPSTLERDTAIYPEAFAYSLDNFAVILGGVDAEARLDDTFSKQLSALNPEPGSNGDAQLREALSLLPATLRRSDGLRLKIQDLDRSIARRTDLIRERDSKLAEANQIGVAGFSSSQRNREFNQFMQNCTAADQTCVDAYFRILAEEDQTIWQYLGERAPPAVLILFLLATLGGLYRYNLRLTGFHHSRADALEMLTVLYGDVTKLGKDDLIAFTSLADRLAADKVEFGKAKTPTDQAVELARVIAQRD